MAVSFYLNKIYRLRNLFWRLKFCVSEFSIFYLTSHIVNKQWAEFAKGYNGSAYKENKYDTKLEMAYQKYADP